MIENAILLTTMARTKRPPANGKRSLRNLKLTRLLTCNYCDSFLFGSATSSGARLSKRVVSSDDSSDSSRIDGDNLNNLNDETLNNVNENGLNTSEYYGESNGLTIR